MRLLLEYKDFLKSKQILEANQSSSIGIVGDSGVGLYTSQNKDLRTFGEGDKQQALNTGGWSSQKLREALQRHTSTYPDIGLVFVKIGDNDGYRINLAKQNAPTIKNELKRIFPNATRYVMIKGGWGWGGLTKFTTETEPPELVEYYNEFKRNGFEVTQLSQGKLKSDQEAHSIHPGIKSQSEEIKKIISGYKPSGEVIAAEKQLDTPQPTMTTSGSYYAAIDDSISKGTELRRQDQGSMKYNESVEAAQIGLKFLGFDLPKYGADGYFGPETENSVEGFKNSNKIEGDSKVMDKPFFTILKSKLQSGKFDDTQIKKINTEFAADFGKTLSENDGNNMWVYWLAHNQGAYGASELLRVALDPNDGVKFAGDLRPKFMSNWSGKSNHIRRNVGDRGQDGVFKSQIKDAYDAGNDKGVALAFSSYQKWKFNQMFQKGNEVIHTKPEIKEIFQRVLKEKNSNIPFEFLAAISYQESGFNPKSGNDSYKGLFALSPKSTGLSDTEIHDPYLNTKAAIDFWNKNIPAVDSRLTADVKNALKVQTIV
jgi:peptidoglycan hydrolase-like protein with peptidoglycan-binding domain